MLSHLITDFCRHWSKLWGQCISSETLHTVDERLGCSCTCFSVVIRHVTRKHLKGKVTRIELCDSVPRMKNCVTVLIKLETKPLSQTKSTVTVAIKLEMKPSSQTKSTARSRVDYSPRNIFPFQFMTRPKSPYPIEDLALKSCLRPALYLVA